MQTYYIVVGASKEGTLDVEVHARKYEDVEPCPTCGGSRDRDTDYDARLDAAYTDGLALGKMLQERAAVEFERGLLAGLGG